MGFDSKDIQPRHWKRVTALACFGVVVIDLLFVDWVRHRERVIYVKGKEPSIPFIYEYYNPALIKAKEVEKYEAQMARMAEMEGTKPLGLDDTEGERFDDVPESEKGFYVPRVQVNYYGTGAMTKF